MVRTYQVRVRSACLSLLLNADEADDAAQEVFIKAFSALHQYRKDLSFGAWLHRIASNHCLDLLRKRKRQKTDSLDALIDQSGEKAAPPSLHVEEIPDQEREQSNKTHMVMAVLKTLSPEQVHILTLREIEELSYEEIGSVLQCTLDAVKARLRRARAQLQDHARHFLTTQALNK